MRHALIPALALLLGLGGLSTDVVRAQEEEEATIEDLIERIDDLEDRLEKPERHAGADRVDFSGDFRFEAHSIAYDYPAYFDGMALQGLMVDSLFYAGSTGGMFPSPAPDQTVREFLNEYINSNADTWVQYQQYLNALNFDDLKSVVNSFPPALQQQLFALLLPETYRAAQSVRNEILYTNRLRLRFRAKIASNVKFDGRLSMYKVFGDSTGVQVFNGQPMSISFDGTTTHVPNSDIVRVDRAYFDWTDIGGVPFYLSIGRRPSTGGAPLNFRQDEPRGGSPLGSVIDYQFDGITAGYHLSTKSTVRLCYGLGYESGYGNGLDPLFTLDDTHFLGLNWDIWNTDEMFIQATLAEAFDVTDGFNGLVVLPVDPLTGQESPAPAVLRYTPTANLGNLGLAGLVFIRNDGPFDWFVSLNYNKSDPENVTTPFGGMFTDPFDTPEKQDGHMYWLGLRYRFNKDRTKIGVEYNHGSEYWFNFALAEDDIVAPKTSVRGDVWEAYITHRFYDKFVAKLSYINYEFDYSGSGWLLGAPKDLSQSPPPILGFPTFDAADKVAFSFDARW